MLKNKRKLNKETLIATSLAYGKCRGDVTKYHVFRQLVAVHGAALAAEMVADALHRCPSAVRRINADVWGFVVWGETNHFDDWNVTAICNQS